MRIVYFGTPDFAVPSLETLARDDRFDVVLVVTQPDRATGRGRAVAPPPVAETARQLGLPLYQPPSLRRPEDREPLGQAGADLFVVAAFGLIFGPATLALPRCGCMNLHASLLPRYRGASPIQAALLSGDALTGVTLMQMDAGLDTGPTLATREATILPGDTTESLSRRLAVIAAELALDALPRYAAGEVTPQPQSEQGATITRLIAKADGWVDWARPAAELERHVRAMWPWPRAWTTINGHQLQIHRSRVVPGDFGGRRPGSIVATSDGMVAVCGRDALALDVVQAAGKRETDGAAFGRGLRGGDAVLGADGGPGQRPPLVVPVQG